MTEQLRTQSRAKGLARWVSTAVLRADGRPSPVAEGEALVVPFGEEPAREELVPKLLWALAVAVVCGVLSMVVYGFTSSTEMGSPLQRQDNFFYVSIAQTLVQDGWYEPTDALGAPHGQELLDFPMGDNHLHFLVLKGLTLFTHNPFAVINLHIVLGFALIGGVTYLCLRCVGVEHWPAAVASVLFAFLPYHFARAPWHTFLQAYWEVPLLLPLLKWAFGGRLLRRRDLEWALVAVLAAIVGSTGVYYAAMLVILLGAAALIEAVRTRRPAALLRAVGVGAAIGLVLVANFAPSISFQRREGVNHELAQRAPREAESFGLRPSLLLLPSPDHRIGRLAQIGIRAQDVGEPSEGPISLGFVAGAGLVLAIGFALVRAVRAGPSAPAAGYLGVLCIVAILVGAKGGLSFVGALFGTQQLRSWSRISVFIGLFALTFLALQAPLLRARLSKPVALAVLGGLLVAGLVDQVPGNPDPRGPELEPEVAADRAFTREMERALPDKAMVFQLPVVRFPEEPAPGTAAGYDELRFQILGTGKLRYSFGALKGRKDQWQTRWADSGTTTSAVAAAAGGFSALLLDRYGYEDDDLAAVEAQLVSLLGPPVSERSWQSRYAWFDLRPLRRRLEEAQPGGVEELGRVVTNPPFVRWSGAGQQWGKVMPATRDLLHLATAEVRSPAPRRVRLEGLLKVPDGGEVRIRHQGTEIARVGDGESRIAVPLTLDRSKSELRFELVDRSTGQPIPGVVVTAIGLQLADPAADVILDLARRWSEPALSRR